MTLPATDLETHAAPPVEGEATVTKVVGRSPMQLAIMRFRKDKLSMIAFAVVAIYFLGALAAPFLVHFGVLDPNTPHNTGKDNLLDEFTLPKGSWGGISWHHWLGVEPGIGRDVLSRVWYGVTFSLVIALSATIITVGLGAIFGIIAGASRGLVDSAIGRLIDLILSFPQTLMLLALSPLFIAILTDKLHVPDGDKANGLYVILILGFFGWPYVARIVRGQVLSIREREFIEAAKLMGASRMRLYFKEILPNLWAPLLVSFTITMPTYISAEAALNYLGVGIKPPTPTLGNVLTGSINYSQNDFFFFFFPAFLIMVIVVSFNLLGDGLRDALDPKGHR
ncbi:MAG: ABC transporter permease [Nocardioidaceae bacterium]|nr:ABC transporter permease [Nocardioidaceae bacterium]